ncbi:MAG TPA: TonB-dependent receptor, partial [Chitinophagaceae bacterium]
SFVAAQPAGQVTGTVSFSEKPVEAATVTLLRSKDSATIKFTVTGKTGQFRIEPVKDGSYIISVQALGYQKYYTPTFELKPGSSEINLNGIKLIAAANKLEEVTVAARKPLIEQKIDRMVVNVDASPTNVGSSAMEVLEKAPGVSVDKDGNISLKGKEGVLVLVDGRPTHLSGADLANMLRTMNANQLEQLEIMTNPPARYDAAGNAGVINIRTKKNRQFGYSGSVTLGYSQGFYGKTNEGFNFNYRKGKVNVFTNFSHNYHKGFGELDIQRNFLDSTSKLVESHFDQQARMFNMNNSFNGKAGLDFFATRRTTFGFVLTGYSSDRDFQNYNVNNLYNPPGNLVEITKAVSDQDETWKNLSGNLNFRQVLDSAGTEITADLDYITYDAQQHHRLYNSYYTPSGTEKRKADTLYGNLPQQIDIYSGKVDFMRPMKKGVRFEAGLKTSFVKTDNNARYDTVHMGAVIRDNNRSNYFLYEENINAAYVNLTGPLGKKWNGQLGLRVENTVSKGNQVTTSEKFERRYTQLFPTAYLQYKPNETHSFVMNYGRRIRRPNYESLNPFIEYLDKYTYQQGNSNLRPQFSHNIELSHTFKGVLTTTLNYTRTTDIIQQVIEQITEDTLTYVKQANIANQRQYGISVSAGMPVTKWWTSNVYVNVFNNRFSGIVNGDQVTISASTLMLNGSQQFKLSKKTSFEISGWYRTMGLEGVIKAKPMGMVSIGYSQQVMKGKGTIRLNLRDVFYTQSFRASTRYGSVDAAFQERRDSRVLNIGFSYRFNKGKLNAGNQRRRNGSASEEQNRVGAGG